MVRIAAIALAIFCCSAGANESAGWWNGSPWSEDREGYFYYPPDKPEPETEPEKVLKPKSFQEMNASEIREEYKRLLDVAVVNPTAGNVLEYQRFKKLMLDQAERFAAVTAVVTWQNPDIDYNVKNPVANFAQTAQRISKNRAEEQIMRDLAQSHGIVFFYSENCAQCVVQAPIYERLTELFGIQVMGVSLDGSSLPGFRNTRPDNGISLRLTGGRGVDVVPSAYLISQDGNETLMLGAGVLAEDELMTRIRLLTTREPENMYQPFWSAENSLQTSGGAAQIGDPLLSFGAVGGR